MSNKLNGDGRSWCIISRSTSDLDQVRHYVFRTFTTKRKDHKLSNPTEVREGPTIVYKSRQGNYKSN